MKSQATDWEKVFTIYIFYKDLRPEYMKKPCKSTRTIKNQQPMFLGKKKT